MFAWIETTPIAMWVSLSLWAYPLLLGAHIVGLAIVVGIFVIRDLRLLGLFQGLHPAAFLPLSKFAWVGFIINAISGALLFTSQAVTFAGNIAFLVKISLIITGMVLAGVIQSRMRSEISAGSAADISRSTKIVALASLLTWAGAIIAGRLVAYVL
ncbi:MAG: hypothetical protein Q8L60_05485 [Gammaproteobacteria bacterium]|nr:hypothetical protein [Gammaproteobacteria bacterium]MDP2140545.1 hypothetical protein [Gammaproteobacteria bacterium]MDP2347314.1 hypothetical protein [Gammaproteobacteria bacterium]